jgi:ABC-type Fe3+-hydroxamate transport system substrate-binding protein
VAEPAAPRRVVSLVPSVTESLVAWSVRPVAVTRFCEHPELTAVGGTKDPDLAAIVALAPDLVVVNDEENRRSDADALAAAGLRLHVTHVEAVDDVDPCLDALAAAVGVERTAEEREAFERLSSLRAAPPAGGGVRSAFVPIWRRPWMTMNRQTYGASVLGRLGLVGLFDDADERYPIVALEQVATRRPDVVLLPSEPYPFRERHRADVAGLADDVRFVDGQDLFWWGVRTPAAIDRLRQSIDA